ncbi:WD40-repeat-containing domain protein [Suillus cothurnatus]|nr:WD40-repeat-containing domain protein [Suillus cothurnatus]
MSGSTNQTIQVWDMKSGKAVCAPFQGHTGDVLSVAISPDGKHIVSGSSDQTIRVWDLEFQTWHQPFEESVICFSTNPTHALHSTSSFIQDSTTPAPSSPNEEGWVVGPKGQLLLWIPPILYPATYAQGNLLVITNNALQLDLSHVAHGTLWHKCREQ